MQVARVPRPTVLLSLAAEMTSVQEAPGATMTERFTDMERHATIPMAQVRLRVLISALLLASLLVALVPAVTRAASFTVTNLNDSGPGSLRQALADAKASAGYDTITFAADLTGTITLTSQVFIDSNVTIQGPGADTLTISGGNTTRVFSVSAGITATIDGLTISNGNYDNGGSILVGASTLTITNCSFIANHAEEWGGVVYSSWSTVTISDSTFSDNTGYIGAAIHSGNSVLRIERTTVERNHSSYVAGGVSSMGTGSVTIVDSIFTDNSIGESGSGGGVYADTNLTVINSTFSNNDASQDGWGGGIAMYGGDLAISGSSFIENTADVNGGYGGAIFATYDASLAITDSEFVENTGWTGGAIYVESDGAATTIDSSTFDRNHASDIGGAVYAGFSVNITNSTFSGNTAKTGGGIGSYHFGSAADNVVANSTFSGNSATDAGSSIAAWSGITLTGSIFADSSGVGSCSAMSSYSSVGEVIDGGYNLSSDATCVSAATSLANTDPLLDALADNGGPTKTHALTSNSPALNRIPAGTLGCGTTLTTDQRGVERPQGSGCDIGAFELVSQYAWSGFAKPIDNDAVNAAKAGSAVPVKFVLSDAPGLAAVTSITSGAVGCASSEPVGEIMETVSAGNSSLRYDAETGQYTYVWKTDKAWSKTCRVLIVTLADGTSHEATFTFK